MLDGEADLAGLPDFVRAAAARAGEERGLAGRHVITLSRSSIEPFLTFSARRDLREKAFLAWIGRGDNGGDTDNKAIIAEIVALRAERARLMGYESFAAYKLADTMAKTPEAALELLRNVWTPAVARAGRERDALQELVREEGGNFALAPWDWRYYAEKLRRREHDLDEAEIKPYLQLERVDRGGLRHRRAAVRARLRRDPGRAALSSRRAHLGGDARRPRMSGCSSATISPGPRSAAAPG